MNEAFDARNPDDYHWARSWVGPTDLENNCPCPKEACGMVNYRTASPECPQHALRAAKTQRSGHPAARCPELRT